MPADFNQFPPQLGTSYGPEELHAYLSSLVALGHTVYRDKTEANIFYVQIADQYQIRISVSEGRSQLQLHYLSNTVTVLNVSSLPHLEEAMATLASRAGASWPSRPTSGRVFADSPATNYRTIAQLIGTTTVAAVFDPYLDNKTLEELRNILSFGSGTFLDGIRLLGGAAKSSAKSPTFTAAGVAAWLSQQGIAGEARVLSSSTEHRRFLLLSDGATLITGHSLNAPHKNEAVRLESGSEDSLFFDQQWAVAQPL